MISGGVTIRATRVRYQGALFHKGRHTRALALSSLILDKAWGINSHGDSTSKSLDHMGCSMHSLGSSDIPSMSKISGLGGCVWSQKGRWLAMSERFGKLCGRWLGAICNFLGRDFGIASRPFCLDPLECGLHGCECGDGLPIGGCGRWDC